MSFPNDSSIHFNWIALDSQCWALVENLFTCQLCKRISCQMCKDIRKMIVFDDTVCHQRQLTLRFYCNIFQYKPK